MNSGRLTMAASVASRGRKRLERTFACQNAKHHIKVHVLTTNINAIMDLFRSMIEAALLSGCTELEFSTTLRHVRCASGREFDDDPDGS